MNFRRYQHELIAGIALLVMLGALLFKQGEISGKEERIKRLQSSVSELKEVVALKEIWGDKNLEKRVRELESVVPASKVKWNQKSKKVTASYRELTINELNTLMKKVLNLGVEIQLLDIKKEGALYYVELRCKW
ncbi:MAG: hypothetical protein PHU67_06995 [Sulfurovum sp.]|nr:hypothetical protein [Sulfurovum sp.]MDD3500192.1 hypothetical protein [Sulfurovum sp.]